MMCAAPDQARAIRCAAELWKAHRFCGAPHDSPQLSPQGAAPASEDPWPQSAHATPTEALAAALFDAVRAGDALLRDAPEGRALGDLPRAVADGFTLLGHYRLTRPRAHISAVDFAAAEHYLTRALALGTALPGLIVAALQRRRLRANAYFHLRRYAAARDDLLEALRGLSAVAAAVAATPEVADADRGRLASWVAAQRAVLCFNLALCARYAGSFDEALLWATAARGAAVLPRQTTLATRADRCVDLLRLLLRCDTVAAAGARVAALRDLEDDPAVSAAALLGLAQGCVERCIVAAVCRALRPRSSRGVLSLLRRGRSHHSADLSSDAPDDVLIRGAVPPHMAAVALDDAAVRAKAQQAAVDAANALLSALTDGAVADITPCFSGGAPEWLRSADGALDHHVFVTSVNLAMTHCSSRALSAAAAWAATREEMIALAPVAPAASPAEDGPELPPPLGSESGSASPASPCSPEVPAPRLAACLEEFGREEAFVLFDFDPIFLDEIDVVLDAATDARDGPGSPTEAATDATSACDSAEPVSPAVSTPPPSFRDEEALRIARYTPPVTGLARTAPLLGDGERRSLHRALPPHVQCFGWRCVFASREHGTSFQTLYRRCGEQSPLLLILMDHHRRRCGAYLAGPLVLNRRTGSMGESFVWSLPDAAPPSSPVPEPSAPPSPASAAADGSDPTIAVYPWAGSNALVLECRCDKIRVGAGSGAALYISEYFSKGATYACDTFASPPLLPLDNESTHDFRILGAEVYALDG